MLAFNRLANRICENCGDKKILQNYRFVMIVDYVYCSKVCQRNHWDTHKLRCRNVNGPLDNGFQAIALLKKKE